jgi:hypothetical protein
VRFVSLFPLLSGRTSRPSLIVHVDFISPWMPWPTARKMRAMLASSLSRAASGDSVGAGVAGCWATMAGCCDSTALTALMTGGVGPPLLAEALTRAICAAAVRLLGHQDINSVIYDTMIDNVRFVADSAELIVRVWHNFVDICGGWA